MMLKEKYLPLVSGWTHSGITCVIFLAVICCRTVASDVKNVKSDEHSVCWARVGHSYPLKCAFELFDSSFFNNTKILEIVKGQKEFNIPIFTANRKLVASVNGGLHDPSYLVFNSAWGSEQSQHVTKRFKYPSLSGIKKPRSEQDIAFMSILELGELIKTKQLTSKELTKFFLKRLKRYNHALEAVVTYTEELAYKQAKEADKLLAQGVYLGPLHGIPYGLKDIIAVPHYKTTWGSTSFKNQVLDIEAWVYKRLQRNLSIEDFRI